MRVVGPLASRIGKDILAILGVKMQKLWGGGSRKHLISLTTLYPL